MKVTTVEPDTPLGAMPVMVAGPARVDVTMVWASPPMVGSVDGVMAAGGGAAVKVMVVPFSTELPHWSVTVAVTAAKEDTEG